MKKLSAFLIVFLLVLTGVTYLYYTQWLNRQRSRTIFPYIPESAALVYEVANFDKQWSHFQKTPLAKTLSQIPVFAAIQQNINELKSLLDISQSLNEVSPTVSVHGLSETHLGYVLYLNTHDTAAQRCLLACKHGIHNTNKEKLWHFF